MAAWCGTILRFWSSSTRIRSDPSLHGGAWRLRGTGRSLWVVARLFVSIWSRNGRAHGPFPFRLITPEVLDSAAPSGTELVKFGERAYAQFSRAFERAATEEILRYDPATTVVLAERCFRRAGLRGAGRAGISHLHHLSRGCGGVLRGNVRQGLDLAGNFTVRWYPRLRRVLPRDHAGLIWEKNREPAFDTPRHSSCLSEGNARGHVALLSGVFAR